MALRFWGQRLVLLGVLGRSCREMEFGLVKVKFESPVPHSKGGTENMCSERGQGSVGLYRVHLLVPPCDKSTAGTTQKYLLTVHVLDAKLTQTAALTGGSCDNKTSRI